MYTFRYTVHMYIFFIVFNAYIYLLYVHNNVHAVKYICYILSIISRRVRGFHTAPRRSSHLKIKETGLHRYLTGGVEIL